jgi:diguanylate cyclase (GGDEF)-like protein
MKLSWQNWFRLGIRGKLTLLVLCASLIPLGFLGWQAFNEQKRVIQEEVRHSHDELSTMLAHGIYENLEYTRKLMESIAELDLVKRFDPKAVPVAEDFFTSLTRQFPFFRVLYLVDNQRRVVAGSDRDFVPPADLSFTSATKREYLGSLSERVASDSQGYYVTLEVVVRNYGRTPVGILGAKVNLAYIETLLKKALTNSKSKGMILDEEGKVIARSSPDIQPLGISAVETINRNISDVKDFSGTRYLMTAVSISQFYNYQGLRWTIVLQIPEREAFSAAYQLRDKIISLFILTALFSIIFSILLSSNFTSSLLYLIAGARKFGRGDFSGELKPQGTDEIGELTKTFEEMRVNLKNTKADLDYRILQLSTLYEVGKAISSILDFQQLQNLILETVARVMRAEKGSLMLLDETERVLTIGVAVGLTDEVTREAKVGLGEPIAGWVIESGNPLFVQDVETDHTFLALKKKNVIRGTLMSVPLKAKDKLLGVLNVSKSIPHSFTDNDFELFKNLANQAAIAIENARLYRYAVTDEMTKLYNHRYFQQRLDEELQRADRYESQVSLIILDVDHFKKFNDTYGHPEGDRVLKTVSRLIEKNIREVDIPARYGGEEFVVICPEKDGEGAMTPANRIRTAIEGFDFRINGQHVPITVSLGVAHYPSQAQSKTELVSLADTALYFSKGNGRNLASQYSPEMRSEEAQKKREIKKAT